MPEVYAWEQVQHLGLLHRMQHPLLGDHDDRLDEIWAQEGSP